MNEYDIKTNKQKSNKQTNKQTRKTRRKEIMTGRQADRYVNR